MTQDEKWELVKQSLDTLQVQLQKMSERADFIGLMPESAIIQPFNNIHSVVIEALEALVGDNFKAIEWYVFDCDFGNRAMEAGFEEDMREIDSVESLRWLIESVDEADES